MSFMEPQITEKQNWYEVDTKFGTFWYPALEVRRSDLVEGSGEYGPADVEGITLIVGHGARLSASGYMDCTDWCVFDSAEEAARHLLDAYYDMADDEMDDDQRDERDWLESIANEAETA